MRIDLISKVVICIASLGGVLYAYLEQQNDLTKLRIRIPELAKEVRLIEEENTRLKLEIDRYENPKHLMELARRPEFSHLKHPLLDDILVVKPGKAMQEPIEIENNIFMQMAMPSVVIGARQ